MPPRPRSGPRTCPPRWPSGLSTASDRAHARAPTCRRCARVGAALLGACGDCDEGRHPERQRERAQEPITTSSEAVDGGRCDDVAGQRARSTTAIEVLPPTVDDELVSDQRDGADDAADEALRRVRRAADRDDDDRDDHDRDDDHRDASRPRRRPSRRTTTTTADAEPTPPPPPPTRHARPAAGRPPPTGPPPPPPAQPGGGAEPGVIPPMSEHDVDRRPLRDRRPPGRRRHVHGPPRVRLPARAPRRDQAARRAPRRRQPFISRFRREALSAARLVHPNIVQVFDFGLDEPTGRHFIVMEYVQGQSCAEILRDGAPERRRDARHRRRRLPRARLRAPQRRRAPRRQAGQPPRSDDGVVKLADFGIAKATEQSRSPRPARCSAPPPTSRPSRPAARRPARPPTSTRSGSSPTSS